MHIIDVNSFAQFELNDISYYILFSLASNRKNGATVITLP